jgi:hypothetical protein
MRRTTQKTAKIEWFRFWPKKKPIPEGWEVTDDFEGCHHYEHAVIIRKLKASRCAQKS